MWLATRFSSSSARKNTALESSLENVTRIAASKASAIQRHSAVSISFQLTSGSGKCFSMGESLASRASCGINATLAEEKSHTESPDRRVTRSSCKSSVRPFSVNESTCSWLPSGFRLREATSNRTS